MKKDNNSVNSLDAGKDRVVSACQFIVSLVIVIILAVFLSRYIGSNYVVSSRSMETTLMTGDTVLIDKATYQISSVKRFDVILFATENDSYDIKRVVGLPGETIQIRGGQICINGEPLDIPKEKTYTEGYSEISVAGLAVNEIVLGENEYFVLGDWVEGSEDSRFETVGNIKKEDIVGKIWFRIEPVKSIGVID